MNSRPRRLLVTADLHFGVYPDGDAACLKLAEFVLEGGADALALAGDVGGTEPDTFAACLDLFAGFPGLKMVVPGNHDVWADEGGSMMKYREALPAVASDHGFVMLDRGPTSLGRVGFIGNIGWYDYSFRNRELNIPLEQYEQGGLPGVCTWNDSRFIDWEYSDAEFTEECTRKLMRAYRRLEPEVDHVVAVMHHVPFRELLYGRNSLAHEFCRAYLGSERAGEMLLRCPKVRYVFCGHRHGAAECAAGYVRAFCVGSDYHNKLLIDLDLATGRCMRHVFDGAEAAPSQGRDLR